MADYRIPTFPLKRLRYYNNQFLNDQDFIDDQAANISRERAQLRALCTPGVWEGLVVTYATLPTTAAPTVGIGIAADNLGRLIVLNAAASGPAPSTLGTGSFVLSIQYNEVETDMSNNTGGSAGVAGNTRFTSQPVLAATAANAVPAGAVVLGSFTVTGGQITARSDAGRQYAGLRLPGPALAGNPPPATLANRNDGSADGAQLSGTLTVQKTSATAIGPSLTLNNPNATPGAANAGGAIDFNSYDPGTSAPTARIQSLGDANFSSHLSVSTKQPGAAANALIERLRITSSGAAQFTGAVSALSLAAPTFNGAVNFTGAVTMASSLGLTGQVATKNFAETNVAPQVLNRDHLGNTRSVIDHNGYRMGQVSEISDDWCTGYITTSLPLAAANPVGGTWTFGDGLWGASGAFGSLVIPLDGSIPVGAIVTSILCKAVRSNATDVSSFFYTQKEPGNRLDLASKSITTGFGHITIDVLVSPTTGHGPLQLGGFHAFGGFPDMSFIQFDSVHTSSAILEAIKVTYYLPPPGWTWTQATANASSSTPGDSLVPAEPSATINQRGVQLIGVADGISGSSVLTPQWETFFDKNCAYVLETMVATGTITDASAHRLFMVGVQNNNGGAADRFVTLYNDNTFANWQLQVVGTSTVNTDTGVAIAANTAYRLRLEMFGSAVNSSGNVKIRLFINGAKVAEVTSATLPAADKIRPFLRAATNGTTGGPYDITIGRLRRVWNHLLTPDAL